MRRAYRGAAIEVTFDLARCTHVGECVLGLPNVFDLERRPWIDPDAASADEIAAVIERCPSGALRYERLDGHDGEHAEEPATVTPIQNGPLRVRGRLMVRLEDGSTEEMTRASLCRCGQSEQKPFCDNSHLRVRFRAPGEIYRPLPSPVRPEPGRPLRRSEDPRRRDMPAP